MSTIKIAPSILSANFGSLAGDIALIETEADLLHIDIMDGHYVPNLTIGACVVRDIRKESKLFFESHLMVSNPDDLLDDFIAAGSDRIVVHPETCPHLNRTLSKIRESGIEAGLAVNPTTSFDALALSYIGSLVNSLTIMSVNPGFPAQKLIPSSIQKICDLRQHLKSLDLNQIQIEVDGGINLTTASEVVKAGADILVAGNAIFGAADPVKAIQDLKVSVSLAV
ncbi:MAG: ribulose-phosphate 3-epimerase [Candidatus Caenarcaniphilales bacterium]|nr:ribulose-phosphate 3-epimerase [Candidatus Caenarcaniphilales bacterium]